MFSHLKLTATAVALALTTPAFAVENPTVGGAAMMVEMNIVENALNSPIHTTLVAAVVAAELVDTLASAGPFTVFAPVNTAFEALPEGTVETLLKPENKATLVKILTAHVVSGNWSGAAIMAEVVKNGGAFQFDAVSGDTLWAKIEDGKLYIVDESGGAAEITIADVNQSNGVIHVIDKVLLPE